MMIGTTPPSPQRIVAAALLTLLAAGCGGGGGGSGSSDALPVIVTAAFAGAGSTPAPGDTLLLVFSEPVSLVGGALLTDADVALSGGASLGTVTTAPASAGSNAVSITLGAGVTITPGSTTIALAPTNDAVRDQSGQLGTGGTPVTIGTSDGVAPTISNVTVAAIDDELNGTGTAGGTLQVPSNGWSLDLAYSDNSAIATAQTQITADVAVSTTAGTQPPGTNLLPFLTTVSASNTAARYRVPTTTVFPNGAMTLSCLVVDASGLASATSTFALTVRAFTDALRPFETNVNPSQVWFVDFARDLESYTTSAITGGISVDVVAGASGTSDFEDLLRVLGLTSASPLVDVNAAVIARVKAELLAELAAFYDGANVTFTLTQPAGSFGGSSSVPYSSLGYSMISVAGQATSAGVLGLAIFDPSNTTQNDNTQEDFQSSGQRLGVFLHTIVDAGMGPPSSSLFRLTFDPFAPSQGGTPIGDVSGDDLRLSGATTDSRSDEIDTAIGDLARFAAIVVAHECGHSMGLVQNGAMPVGLYGNDTANFPGSSDGHIRTAALFPAGSTNIMSPALSYNAAVNPFSAFNSLNLAYLQEQVFYGN